MTLLRPLVSTLSLLALLTTGAVADKAKSGKATLADKSAAPAANACPARHQLNDAADKSLGCQFAVPSGLAPATATEFDQQTLDTTPAAYRATPKTHASEVKGAGNGGIRCPQYVKTSKETTIYRLYGSPGQAGKYGAYWTLQDDPHDSTADKDTYRKHYAICTAWNDLSNHVACKLPKGVVLQVGPGESVHKWKKGADCQSVCKGLREGVNESYQVDRALQVVLPNTSEFCDKPAAPRAIAPGGGQGKKGK